MRRDFTIVRGDSRQWAGVVLGGLPEPGLYDVEEVWFSVPPLFQKTLDDGLTIEDSAEGLLTIDLVPGDTDGAPPSRVSYDYDVQVRFDDGKVVTALRGRFIVLPDSTTVTE